MGFVVASAALHDLLRSTSRRTRVVAVLPAAAYLEVVDADPHGPRMVALLARDAVRVPVGLVTALPTEASPFASLQVGAPGRIGDGVLELDDGPGYRPLRYWDPRVPRFGARLRTGEARHRADALGLAAAGLPAASTQEWESAAAPLRAALASPRPSDAAVAAAADGLVGLGPGLTPAGDDVLAGALVTLAAAGDVARQGALAAAVKNAQLRTTPVSAALLDQACHGRSVPEVTELLRALAGSADLDAAIARLARVGHTSGAALALGIRSALRALDRHELGRVA